MTGLHETLVIGAAAGAALAGGSAGAYALFAPRCQWLGPVVFRGPRDGPPRVALTFDDGPSAEATPAILDVLGELRVPATFFVIGASARRHAALLQRLAAEGHLIGNHSFHHHYSGLFGGPRYWDRELAETDAVIAAATGQRPALFRPPMGFKSPTLVGTVRRQGLTTVTWTRRARDGCTTTPGRILARLAERAGAGDILMLHDGREPHSRHDLRPTVEALRPLIERLRARGLTIVRVDQLLGCAGYQEAARTPPSPAQT